MLKEITFAFSWTVALASLVLPFKLVVPGLLSIGLPAFIAFLAAAALAFVSFLALGALAMSAEERLGVRLMPRRQDSSSPVGAAFGIALCLAGGWAVVKIASMQ